MSLKKKVKKAVRKTVINPFKKTVGMFTGGSDDDGGGEERSEAASQLIKKDVNRQAGGGQINFTTEEWT